MDARASVRRLTRINEIIMATSDDERALWWQISEEVIDYLRPAEVMAGEVTLEGLE